MISIGNLIERDGDELLTYQIQAFYNCARIVKIKQKLSDICLFEYNLEHEDIKYKCAVIQYSLTKKDIENKNYPIVGCLITNNNRIIATLDYIFLTDKFEMIGNIYEGKFQVVLTNVKNEKHLISEFENYCGDNNVVNLLMNVLTDNIENFFI